jgi:methylase of polypeptide subunit release factors
MGKRSDFERIGRDFYPTPMEAVLSLLPHLKKYSKYYEPCAGDGRLVKHLAKHNHDCIEAWDIEPQDKSILQENALDIVFDTSYDYIITNPPWDRKILHPMIEHFSNQLPTWLLFDADWMHTKQSSELMKRCEMVVSIGRVKWIEGSQNTGKDNCCWYLFTNTKNAKTVFIGR